MGKIGDPRAIDPLINTLKDNEERARALAARSLGMIGDPRAINPLICAQKDHDRSVRISAKRALNKLGCQNMPSVEPNLELADEWFQKGLSLYFGKKPEEAIQAFDCVIELDPDDAQTWFYKGRALSGIKKWAESTKNLARSIELGLGPTLKHNVLNHIVVNGNKLRDEGKYDAAIKSYDEALKINPNDIMARNRKAAILESKANTD